MPLNAMFSRVSGAKAALSHQYAEASALTYRYALLWPCQVMIACPSAGQCRGESAGINSECTNSMQHA